MNCHLCHGMIVPGDETEIKAGRVVHVHPAQSLAHLAAAAKLREIRASR
jgi:hypothetical protein